MFQIHADAWGCPVVPPYGQYSLPSQVIIVVPHPLLEFRRSHLFIYSVFYVQTLVYLLIGLVKNSTLH